MYKSYDLKQQFPISKRYWLKKTFAWLIFGIVFLFASYWLFKSRNYYNPRELSFNLILINLAGLFIFLIKLIYNILYDYTLRYRIEDYSFMISKGVILKQQGVIPFQQVTDLFIKRDYLDFIFGLYSFEVHSASDHENELSIIKGFCKKNADALRRSMRQALDEYHSEYST